MWHQQIMIESVRRPPVPRHAQGIVQSKEKWNERQIWALCFSSQLPLSLPLPLRPGPAEEWQAPIRDMKIKGNKSFKWLQLNFWRF